jgi:hypothetical protein
VKRQKPIRRDGSGGADGGSTRDRAPPVIVNDS